MELNNYKKKLKLLFEKFTEEGFHLNSYYSKALVKYFEDSPHESIERHLMETPFFSDLVLNTLLNVEEITCRLIKILLIEMITLLLQNENQYCKLTQQYGFQTIISKIRLLNETIKTPAFQLAFIRLPAAQISHDVGLTTVVEQKTWKYILTQNTHLKPVTVADATYNFISKLIWKLNESEEEMALIEILQYILSPILESDYFTKNVTIDIDSEEKRAEQIRSYLQALLAIFKETHQFFQPNKVMHHLKLNFLLRGHLHYIGNVSRDDRILMTNFELIFRFYFASCIETLAQNDNYSNNEFLNEMMTAYNNTVITLLKRKCLSVLSNYIVKCTIFWSKLDDTIVPSYFELNGQTFDIRNQLVILLVVPILTYAYCCNNDNSYVDNFGIKITALATEHIVKSYYLMKTHIIKSGEIKKICLQVLGEIFKLRGHLNVAQAGIIYQALYYAIYSTVIHDGLENGHTKKPKSMEDLKILTFVLDLMIMLLKEHDITWYESLEIMCFQNTLMNLMGQNQLPTKLLLQALNLIDWSIKKFLSPDLTLLAEFKNESTLVEIGKNIRAYLYHDEWEVRDSALQVIITCTEVSYVKYEPLQKLIVEYDLLIEAASMSLNDNEYYVQATALRCLSAATKIERMWTKILAAHPKLNVKLVELLLNHPEGLVRKEAANVLKELYVNQRKSDCLVKYLYMVMKKAAISDLHWEVQISALHFWRQVVQTLLSDKGMIDGTFPSVTFSKEKRKIIILNEMEIWKQLILLMNNLSSIGCLTVLQNCLNDDCIVVVELACAIAKELIDILDTYKFPVDSELLVDEKSFPPLTDGLNLKMEVEKISSDCFPSDYFNKYEQDIVIEKILGESSADLIREMFDEQCAIKKIEQTPLIERKTVYPRSFILNFKKTDYLSNETSKRNSSSNNLDLLLDEILNKDLQKSYDDDCAKLPVNPLKKLN